MSEGDRKPRGTAAMDLETRVKVSRAGGTASAMDRERMKEIGRKGGQVLFQNRGREYFVELGKKAAAASVARRLALKKD